MKRNHFLLAAFIISLTACSTYRQTQTPDDVYYSPGEQQEQGVASNSTAPNNGEYYSTPNDQYIRLKAQDPNRWSYFDDYSTDYYGAYSPMGYSAYGAMGYGVSAYGYYGPMGFGMTPWIGFGYCSPMTFWNSYYTWNSFYNPYYGGMIVTNPKVGNVGTVTRLSTFNPSSYTNYSANRSNIKPSSANTPYEYSQTIRRNYNANSYSPYGNTRQSFYRPSVNNNNTLSNQNRSYSPRVSSFGGSGGGGGMSRGGGGGGISRGR